MESCFQAFAFKWANVRRYAPDAGSAREASAAVLALMDRLLPNGRDVNHRDDAGETALTARAEAGDARDVRALLAVGADPRAASDSQWTALHGGAVLYSC
jgi:ankyrin repeat protein